MRTRWLTAIKNKWHRVGGALAVLLMFYIPVTRAVLAAARTTTSAAPAAAVPNAIDTGRGTKAGASGTGPTTPRNPSPKVGTGKGTGKSARTRSGLSGHHTGHPTARPRPAAI